MRRAALTLRGGGTGRRLVGRRAAVVYTSWGWRLRWRWWWSLLTASALVVLIQNARSSHTTAGRGCFALLPAYITTTTITSPALFCKIVSLELTIEPLTDDADKYEDFISTPILDQCKQTNPFYCCRFKFCLLTTTTSRRNNTDVICIDISVPRER